jgi:hypothetical protein
MGIADLGLKAASRPGSQVQNAASDSDAQRV